jgi:hypothetical protein
VLLGVAARSVVAGALGGTTSGAGRADVSRARCFGPARSRGRGAAFLALVPSAAGRVGELQGREARRERRGR